ncbi:ABC transporter ATP-binding protein [Meridianimarinicoccus sp. RP-17]|uniref:ABC transporter ATP-binding protein n=1 Tax=Meridianimarinicoccus zhengii TaxID=2056810 RepID=UPI000DABC1A5|nr:ABC transporter ATP-binding protein [Phycocomes zhengii]
MTEPGAILEVTGLRKRFGALQATDDVSLDLHAGEIHALIGPNGAGKSTLIGQISGALRPDAGRVAIAGQDVTAMDTAGRARLGLARTFQISALAMDMTVLQNVVLGVAGAQRGLWRFWRPALRDPALLAPARAALARTGLTGEAATQVAALSHGQRRRLELAMALVLRPRLFVMDEPLAGLGTDGSAALTRTLDTLRVEAPILLVEHDMDAVFRLADRISVLVEGRIVATGPPDAIRGDRDVRRAYLGEDGP